MVRQLGNNTRTESDLITSLPVASSNQGSFCLVRHKVTESLCDFIACLWMVHGDVTLAMPSDRGVRLQIQRAGLLYEILALSIIKVLQKCLEEWVFPNELVVG